MRKTTQRWLSILLSLVLIFQMVPVQAFALEAEPAAGEKTALLLADPRLAETEPGANSSETVNYEPETAEIVAEIPEGRDEFQKEFLLSNGLRMISVYGSPVHYEEDGQWKEIDNTLQPVSSTGAVLTGKAALTSASAYKNTAGIWDVSLPTSLTANTPVTVSRDGYSLSFLFSGELHNDHVVMSAGEDVCVASTKDMSSTETLSLSGISAAAQESVTTAPLQASSAQLAAAQETVDHSGTLLEETILPKLNTALVYEDIYDNTDLRYDLSSHTLKESVIINSPSETLAGYSYTLTTAGLVLELQDDDSILAYAADAAEGDAPVFTMPAPYLADAEHAYSGDVSVTLTGSNGSYTLTYRLPRQWMAAEERVYPVILDPIVDAKSHTYTIEDQSVFQYNQFGYLWEYLEAGYDYDYGKERIFIKFTALPELSSADVIVSANLHLKKVASASAVTMEAHEVLGTWTSSSIKWSNMPSCNSKVEDYQNVGSAGWYSWDITNIVQKWYNSNTGVMLRMSDSVENGSSANFQKFYSSDAYSGLPALYITYLNNCGLEDYWDYTSQSAGRAGTGHVNNFTGNLVWIHNGLSFSGNRMPVSISHVYNANDKDNNGYGLGYGWRTNYNQRVYQWTEDSSYYVWEDQDGTRRYFKYSSSGTYKNEIDNTLVLITTGSGTEKYCITDKNNNKSYFDTSGRLSKISNYQQTISSINIAYSGSTNRITSITDGAGRVYTFNYNSSNLLSSIVFKGTGSDAISTLNYSYDGSYNLTGITYPDNKSVAYSYASNHLLTRAADVGGYAVHYSYTDHAPYRVDHISESDTDASGTAVDGGALSIEYAHNQTTFVDHNGNKEIMQFNNYGSTVSIQDGQGRAQFMQYAGVGSAKSASQLTLSSKLQNTVVNIFRNGGFEWWNYWDAASENASTGSWDYTDDYAYRELYSLKINRTADGGQFNVNSLPDSACVMEAGKTYTLSGYVKTVNMDGGGNGAKMALKLANSGAIVATSEAIKVNSDWTRLSATYEHPANAANEQAIVQLSNESSGTAYFDALMLEPATTASRHNILENGDFGRQKTTSTDAFSWHNGDNCGSTEKRVLYDGESAAPQLDNYVYTMTGSPTQKKQYYQRILISGKAGDVYSVSGWGKGDSVPLRDGSGRRFGILYRFNYSDGSTGETMINFNPDTDSANSWQFVASRVVAEKDYDTMWILLVCDYNQNTVYFDGLQLFKEEFGQSYTYDDNGNVTSVIDLQKQKTTYEYANNNLTKMVLPNGASQTYTYDTYHNVLTATSPEGVISTFTYDEYGNNKSVSVSGNGTTQSLSSTATYTDNGNQLASVTDPLGKVTTYGYNTQTGVLDWVQAPDETETTRTNYTHDSLYRTTNVAKGSSDVTYTYETDLLNTIQSASDTTYEFDYGVFDLVQSIGIGDRTLISHEYSNDANRYLTKSTYGNDDYISYVYDDYGRTTSKIYENGDTVEYKYDNNGNLGLMTDSATGRTTKYLYDFQDRLSRYEESGNGYSSSVEWTYNTDNNLTTQAHVLNGTTYTTNYTYDDDNRLTGSSQDSVSSTYAYDALGRMTSITGMNGSAPVVTTNIGYTSTDNSTSSQVASWANYLGTATTSAATYNYAYDDRGNITEIRVENTLLAEYSYDNLDQLIVEKNHVANKRWEYAYDAGGNILSKTEFSSVTAASGGVTTSYVYDDANGWEDLLTSYSGQALSYDGIGNLTNDGSWTYTWEHGRQLVSMSKSGTNISYAYNADGMRISKDVGGTIYHYHYLGDQLVEMTWGSNKMSFVYDVLGPAAVIYNGTTYYYTRNAQGDVTSIVNASGTQVVAYNYDAWGNLLSTTGTMAETLGATNPLRYRGYVYDSETGLYYLQSRYYNPSWGRFINADGYLSTGGGVLDGNMFSYCGNNPVMGYDPTGEINWSKLFSGTGLLAIGVMACLTAAAVVTAGACTPLLIAAGATFVAGGMTVLNGAAEVVESFTDYNYMRDSVYGGDEEAYENQKDFFATTAEIGSMAISGAAGLYDVCFVAGTVVLTAEGLKAIEKIEAGEFVWAYNEAAQQTDLKKVVQTFVNETNELVHIQANGEEIVCTPEHPFYSPVKGWTAAIQLRAGDILVTVNGEYVVVEQIQHEILEAPITVYNFEVEGFHTYYVGADGVLVHNSCNHNVAWARERRAFWKQTATTANIGQNYGSYVATADNIDRMRRGLAPIGWDNFSVQLHHWEGIANNFYNYSPLSRTLHSLIHRLG